MGRDKRFLKVKGKSVFDRTLSLLMDTFVETVVVLAEPIESLEVRDCRVVYDVIPNAGSLGGLYTGLLAAAQPRIFAVACDMPFLHPDVIRYMVSFDEMADVVVAELQGQFHPMHAVYSKRCTEFLKAMAERQNLKIQTLYRSEALRVAVVGANDLSSLGVGLRSFENINTPDDLTLADAAISDKS
ncbi:MAG: molybdenum cofactor guanylyltransferase [Nitrospira sp.]|nr:molybdenum cofactor guanylyltransferase [Nitrospira sp.]